MDDFHNKTITIGTFNRLGIFMGNFIGSIWFTDVLDVK